MKRLGLLDEVTIALTALAPPPATTEVFIQAMATDLLRGAGFLVGREERAGGRNRIDIVVRSEQATVGIEVKKGRPGTAVVGQLRRYAASGRFTGLVLLCERAISVPDCGVPVRVVGFGRSRGVAL